MTTKTDALVERAGLQLDAGIAGEQLDEIIKTLKERLDAMTGIRKAAKRGGMRK
jgi:hypothetical protein